MKLQHTCRRSWWPRRAAHRSASKRSGGSCRRPLGEKKRKICDKEQSAAAPCKTYKKIRGKNTEQGKSKKKQPRWLYACMRGWERGLKIFEGRSWRGFRAHLHNQAELALNSLYHYIQNAKQKTSRNT